MQKVNQLLLLSISRYRNCRGGQKPSGFWAKHKFQQELFKIFFWCSTTPPKWCKFRFWSTHSKQNFCTRNELIIDRPCNENKKEFDTCQKWEHRWKHNFLFLNVLNFSFGEFGCSFVGQLHFVQGRRPPHHDHSPKPKTKLLGTPRRTCSWSLGG